MATGDDLKREQIREFFDGLTESERHRLMTGFAIGMFGPCNGPPSQEELRAMQQMAQASPRTLPPLKQNSRRRFP